MEDRTNRPTESGIPAQRKPAYGESLSGDRYRFTRPALTPDQRTAVQNEAREMEEAHPEMSMTAIRRILATKYGVSLTTVRTLY